MSCRRLAALRHQWHDEQCRAAGVRRPAQAHAGAGRLNDANFNSSGKLLAADMINPKVQVYGDVAILSYNYVGVAQNKDGETEPVRAKSTRVHVKKSNDWMLVHANFAPDPRPRD